MVLTIISTSAILKLIQTATSRAEKSDCQVPKTAVPQVQVSAVNAGCLPWHHLLASHAAPLDTFLVYAGIRRSQEMQQEKKVRLFNVRQREIYARCLEDNIKELW